VEEPEADRHLLLHAAGEGLRQVVPLVGENRIITSYGLGHVKRTRFEGLNAMIDQARLREEKIDAFHVGFVLGPRLNACGRMGHARDALRLLTTARGSEAREIAAFLNNENERRRKTERAIYNEAVAMVESRGFDSDDRRAIVVASENWHAGVIGIVASRLVDAFSRPAIVLNIESGEAHGSARSVTGVAMHEALETCRDLLDSFGGHAMAAGMRLASDNVDALRDRVVAYCNDLIGPDDLVGMLDVDADCSIADLSVELIQQIRQLAPFGRANPAPLMCLRDAVLDQQATRVGREGMHLRMLLRQGSRVVQTIGFGLGELAPQLPHGARVDIVFEPKVGTWQGQLRMEMFVKDVRLV